mmetsp:Transcript_9328/g.28436  ORF Transcript_9328/g.28436 Transcript_9328/m.28436 type:complete len:376 (-) Transcript_9328:505-1632(-)
MPGAHTAHRHACARQSQLAMLAKPIVRADAVCNLWQLIHVSQREPRLSNGRSKEPFLGAAGSVGVDGPPDWHRPRAGRLRCRVRGFPMPLALVAVVVGRHHSAAGGGLHVPLLPCKWIRLQFHLLDSLLERVHPERVAVLSVGILCFSLRATTFHVLQQSGLPILEGWRGWVYPAPVVRFPRQRRVRSHQPDLHLLQVPRLSSAFGRCDDQLLNLSEVPRCQWCIKSRGLAAQQQRRAEQRMPAETLKRRGKIRWGPLQRGRWRRGWRRHRLDVPQCSQGRVLSCRWQRCGCMRRCRNSSPRRHAGGGSRVHGCAWYSRRRSRCIPNAGARAWAFERRWGHGRWRHRAQARGCISSARHVGGGLRFCAICAGCWR